MKLLVIESDEEYRLVKEKPYQELLTIDTLIPVVFLFFVLIMIKLYLLIPIIIIFTLLASLQTLEDNFMLIINKQTKEFSIDRYYMGIKRFRSATFDAADFKFVQVEKQVTSIREDGRFSINFLTEPKEPNEPVKILTVLKNIDLEDIEHAKVISFMLGLLYESKIKYKVELI
jgi:hypothetical protein